MTASATCAIGEVPRLRTITDSYDYDAFGNKINSTGTAPNSYLYRGEQYDSDLGPYYLRQVARSKDIRKWTEPESVVPRSSRLYRDEREVCRDSGRWPGQRT